MKRLLMLSFAGLTCLSAMVLGGCPPSFQADFTYEPLEIVAGDTVKFKDTSSGNPVDFTWDFGDSSETSKERNPEHVYEKAGSYTVRLTVREQSGNKDTATQTVEVQEYKGPQADFSADKILGPSPMKVTFTDLSQKGSSAIVKWTWDFGDGAVSEQAGKVTHTYTVTSGRKEYSVKLTITDGRGASHTRTKNKYIVTENPIDSVKIEKGGFQMGIPDYLQNQLSAEEDLLVADETNRHDVELSAYYIAKYETTNAQFARVLNYAWGKGYLLFVDPNLVLKTGNNEILFGLGQEASPIELDNNAFVPKTRVDGGGQTVDLANFPVVEVTWEGAAMFCNWLSEMFALNPCYDANFRLKTPVPNGFRLPTEAEWERAAGWEPGKNGIILSTLEEGYMWNYAISSDTLDEADANIASLNPMRFSEPPYLTPGGHYTGIASPAGCFDMSGNAEEWIYDWYANAYIVNDIILTSNPTGPAAGSTHVRRGGSYDSDAFDCRSTARAGSDSIVYAPNVGFRVARNSAE